jgi:hypothetical protein
MIITADDYGMGASVNEGIEACLAAGTVRSVCVMTNMPDAGGAAHLRERFPGVSVGLHWTLTTGEPCAEPSRVPSLVDASGRFHPARELRRRWSAKQIDPHEIELELAAQHDRLCALAGPPDFWNTHQNIHVWPGHFQFITRFATTLGLPAMRSHVRHTVPKHGGVVLHAMAHPGYHLKGLMIRRWSRWAAQMGMAMPAGLIYLPGHPGGRTAIEQVASRLRFPTDGAPLELVIHPATGTESEHFGSLTSSRVVEHQYFSQPRTAERLAALGIDLVGFDALLGAASRGR